MATDAALIDQAHAYFNQGNALFEQGRLEEAAESFRLGLRSNRILTGAYNNQGITQARQGQLEEAVQSFREALRINPNHVEARYNLANALKDQQQVIEAEKCYRQVLRINPHYAEAHNNLGYTLKDQERLAEAIDCFRQALRINPNLAIAHNNLGITCKDQGNLDEAVASYRKALQLDPAHADVHYNLANVLHDLGRFAEADESYGQALRIDPNHKTAFYNRAILRLLLGDCAGGWRDFELRWILPKKIHPSTRQPQWDGSALNGKTLLIYTDEGLGDALQFIRYAPLIKQRGMGTILFECQPALLGLLAGVSGVDKVVPAGASLPPFDVQVSLMSLPWLFGTTLADIPDNVPYLTLDPNLVERWRHELSHAADQDSLYSPFTPHPSPLNIGVIWQGSMGQKNDRRSVPLSYLEKIAQIPGVRLLSLQVGPGTEQLKTASFPIIDLGSRFNLNSLEDLAGALVNMDLVVTVDTAAAHLAGALGLPAWVLLQFVPDWRWLLERTDSPWYPTMRLFRERRINDWEDVFERIAAALPTFHPGSTNRG